MVVHANFQTNRRRSMSGPQVPFSAELHATKYRTPGEDFDRAMNRIAGHLADDTHNHFRLLNDLLLSMGFMPAGRVQAASGSTKAICSHNCFVSGVIEDSFTDGHGSIMSRAGEAAETMRKGGGIGYDFSTIRPRGALIKKLQSQASGPLSFMEIFEAVCKCVASAGHRRGAQMGVLRVDHPDIEEFIAAKCNRERFRGFNFSIAITDKFMKCLTSGEPFPLVFENVVYKEVDASVLWEQIMHATYDWAEPGVLFIDTINRMNNLAYCETITATNPCVPGETKILTDRGWREIADCVGEEVQVWNGVEWSSVEPRPTGQDQSLVTVSLSNGESLTCTRAHGFVLEDGTKVEAQELREGDELLELQWPIVESGEDVPEKEAYTQGCFAGDGWYASNDRPYVSFKRADKRALEPYINHANAYTTKQDYRFLYLKGHVHEAKEFVPECDWSVKSRLAWLAGLLDTDGTATWSHRATGERSSCSLMISSVNRQFINDLALLLRTLGVSTNRDVDTRQGEWAKSPACYRISVKASNVVTLLALGLGDHLHRLDLSDNHPRSTNNVRLRVTSVEEAGEVGVVFCFTEPKAHRGCFNGVLSSQCGEQPLPPYGACLLGSMNLVKYLKRVAIGVYEFEWDRFGADIAVAVRAMDNVIDRAIYPLYEQEKEAKSKRRMGIGVTGLANCIEALGHPYGSPAFIEMTDKIMRRLTKECYLASTELAKEKGPFPLYVQDEYLSSPFIQTLDPVVQEAIRANGIRNSHLVSVAPTGTISLTADNVSSGIEPVFAYSFERTIQEFDGPRVERVEDYGVRVLGVEGKRCHDVTVDEHLAVLVTVTRHVDSAVSKTCNVGSDVSWTDFKKIYFNAWLQGCKGCTTFRADGERAGILNITEEDSQPSETDAVVTVTETFSGGDSEDEDAGPTCRRDPVTGRSECE